MQADIIIDDLQQQLSLTRKQNDELNARSGRAHSSQQSRPASDSLQQGTTMQHGTTSGFMGMGVMGAHKQADVAVLTEYIDKVKLLSDTIAETETKLDAVTRDRDHIKVCIPGCILVV